MLKNRIGKWITTCAPIVLVLLAGLMVCAAEAQPAKDAKPIRIGVFYPFSMMKLGQFHSAMLAAEEINQAGGVLVGKVRRPVEVIKYETNELVSPTEAVAVAERAITVDKIDFLVGMMRTEAVLAVQDVAMDHKKIFIGTVADHPDLCVRVAKDYGRYKYWFRLWLPGAIHAVKVMAQTEIAADAVRKELGIKTPKVALLAEKVVWADVIIDKSKETLPKSGMEIVGVWRPSALAADLSGELSAIKATGAQIIQTCLTGTVRSVFSKQWSQTKIPVAPTGWNVNAMYADSWERTKGAVNYEATWATVSRVKTTDKTIPFWDKFIEKFGPENHGANYDAVSVLKEAIERAGTLDPDALVVELEKTDHIGALGREVFTGRNTPYPHDITFGPGYVTGVGIQWVNGKMNTVWPHGDAVFGDKKWVGYRLQGIADYVLPPWMVEYWKKNK